MSANIQILIDALLDAVKTDEVVASDKWWRQVKQALEANGIYNHGIQ